MKKVSWICACVLMISFAGKGQKIRVLNITNLEPISNVLVYSTNVIASGQTNFRGEIDLGKFNEDEVLHFQHPSFQRRSIKYDDLVGRNFKVYLKERIIQIGEVVISANKWEQDKSELPNEIATITPRQVEFKNPQTAADLLESSGQVFVQKSQYKNSGMAPCNCNPATLDVEYWG